MGRRVGGCDCPSLLGPGEVRYPSETINSSNRAHPKRFLQDTSGVLRPARLPYRWLGDATAIENGRKTIALSKTPPPPRPKASNDVTSSGRGCRQNA
ncbi:hypothetical protein IG631_07376 [Alternaria alternata]|nr:hypothetical protein IG631_07376 [Alternaria alternata]